MVLGAAAVLASAWVIVPLLQQSHWAARNQVLEGTGLENGYGASQMLSWLVHRATSTTTATRRLAARHHHPRRRRHRGLHLALALLRGGARPRDHLGGHAAHDVRADDLRVASTTSCPGSSDIFIRRFQMGVQLSGILLAGDRHRLPRAASSLDAVLRLVPRGPARLGGSSRPGAASSPGSASSASSSCSRRPGAAWTPTTRTTPPTSACRPRPTRSRTPRSTSCWPTCAPTPRAASTPGSPTNWGNDFPVGAVPVFKYLESKDIDEVGLHAAHGLAHDRPRVLLRRDQPGRLPALRDRLHHHPGRHGGAGAGRQGRVLGRLLPVGAPRPGLHPRLRHHRRAHGDPGRRRHAERDPAGVAPPRTSSAT